MSGTDLQTICQLQKIMDCVSDNPHATLRDISQVTGLDREIVKQHMQELTADIKERDQESIIVMRDQYIMDIEKDKMVCDMKLQGCMSPREGSRWIEEKRKLRDSQIRLLGLDAPSKQQVDIELTVSKEHRDEIFQAAQMQIVDGEIIVNAAPLKQIEPIEKQNNNDNMIDMDLIEEVD